MQEPVPGFVVAGGYCPWLPMFASQRHPLVSRSPSAPDRIHSWSALFTEEAPPSVDALKPHRTGTETVATLLQSSLHHDDDQSMSYLSARRLDKMERPFPSLSLTRTQTEKTAPVSTTAAESKGPQAEIRPHTFDAAEATDASKTSTRMHCLMPRLLEQPLVAVSTRDNRSEVFSQWQRCGTVLARATHRGIDLFDSVRLLVSGSVGATDAELWSRAEKTCLTCWYTDPMRNHWEMLINNTNSK